MATLSWGKPKVEIGVLGALRVAPIVWTVLTPLVEDSSQFTGTPGTPLTAKGEGGALVAQKATASEYKFVCEIYASDNSKPIVDVNGVIIDNYAIRLGPENVLLPGFIFDESSVLIEETWSAKTGKKWKYTFTAVEPLLGELSKPYTKV